MELRYFKILGAFIGSAVGFFLGNIDGLIITLLAVSILDYITGVAAAICEKKVSSYIGFKGISRKILMFGIIGIANLFDIYVLKQGPVVRTAAIFFYLSNEGISLVENAARIGLPVPQKIRNMLLQLKEKSEK